MLIEGVTDFANRQALQNVRKRSKYQHPVAQRAIGKNIRQLRFNSALAAVSMNDIFGDDRLETIWNIFAASRPRLAGACQPTVAIGATQALMSSRAIRRR